MGKLAAAGLSVALAGTLLTGCMRMGSDIAINTDGSCTLSTEINIEKDAMLEAYTKYLNEENGIDGFTTEMIAVMLENQGLELVKIDDKEYYKISSGSMGGTSKFDHITSYYKSLAGLLYQTEDNVLSLSETSVAIRQPANSNMLEKAFSGDMEGKLSNVLKKKPLRGADADEDYDDESDGLDKVVPWGSDEDDEYYDDDTVTTDDDENVNTVLKFLEDNEFMTSLKTATITYNITFASKIKEKSSNVTLSNSDKTMSVTLPLISDTNYNEYATCENDIAATGALNGVTYKEAVTVTIPEDITATLNGSEITDKTINCDKTGTYNFKLSDGKGTTETLCFIVDASAPVFTRQKDSGKAEFSDFYNSGQALLNSGYIAVYDIESGVSGFNIDSSSVLEDTTGNIYTNADTESLFGQYYVYSLNTNYIEEGSHVINVTDTLGNTSEAEFIIDRTKPSVKGVKNGKTYKKAVKIKFSDKNGIQSATLNEKAFKKGSKVSKNGNYTLKITDKAGNMKTVRFKIRK